MQEKFIYNPDLPFVKNNFPGNRTIKGKFTNTTKQEKPGFSKVLKWLLTKNPQKQEKKEDPFKVSVNSGLAFLYSTEDMIVWLGHASFFIRLNGIQMLTDPVFFDLPLIPRKASLPCDPGDFKNISYILLSHCHRDHLDYKTLKLLVENNPEVEFLAPLKSGSMIKKLGSKIRVQEAGWYQRYKTKKLQIDFLPAWHWNRRSVFDFNKELWGSFMLCTKKVTIYFAGDSAYAPLFQDIGTLYSKIDYALMPIGAYKPAFLMQQYHMSPEQAFKAFEDLKARRFIPMHYGTYDLSDEPPGEPVRLIRVIFEIKGMLDELVIPAIGAEIKINQ